VCVEVMFDAESHAEAENIAMVKRCESNKVPIYTFSLVLKLYAMNNHHSPSIDRREQLSQGAICTTPLPSSQYCV
jgi:hypothetical protein